MGTTYIISDLHLGHSNMIRHRGFNDDNEYFQMLKKRWNAVVKKKDTVIIPGDITNEKVAYYHLLDELNGIKKILGGNHDKPQHTGKLLEHCRSVGSYMVYKGCIISHIPIHPRELKGFWLFNIHGHVHDNCMRSNLYINVSAESLCYTPVSIDAAIEYHKKRILKYKIKRLCLKLKQYLP